MRRSPRPAPPPARPLGGGNRGPRTGLPTARGHRAPHPAGLRPATILEHPILLREAPHSFPTRPWDLPLRPRPFQAGTVCP